MPEPLHIFYSYANEDVNLLENLDTHLGILKRQNIIDTWNSRNVLAGLKIDEEVQLHLNSADIILLLISSDFLASEETYKGEMRLALERQRAGAAEVIPIILRPTAWQDTPFANLQVLPTNGKPVTSWLSLDEAFTDVVNGIHKIIENIVHRQNPIQSTSTQSVSINQTSHAGSSASVSTPSQSGNFSQPSQASVTTHSNTQTPSSFPDTIIPPPQQSSQIISKEGVPDAMKAATDKAVRRLSEDKLGFAMWIKALRNFIISPDTTTPLTIGIDGAWGTGKSSFMYMLQDLLEPSLSFWDRWREIKWPWLQWFGLFIITLPIWIAGKLMIRIGKNIWNTQRVWFRDIADGLSYDPEIDNDIDLKTLSRRKQFWARISAWHCPKQPPSNPTIWFNAWKFDQEEQLWAALALAVLDQAKKKYNFFQRIIFWVALEFKRFSWAAALYYIFLKIALPIVLGLLAWKFDLFIKLATGTYPKQSLQAFENFLPLSQFLLWVGAGLSGVIQVSGIIKDPFQISIKNVFDKPDYKQKVGFIGSFEEDFSAIVSLITRRTLGWKPRKLIIFIDDLDRCKLPKAVDIIEGINLFLDSEQCVFVIGMDTMAVVASIETKYEGLFKQMHRERTDLVSAGRLFLDKIIQVPLHVPPSIETSIDRLVEGITERGVRPLQTQYSSILPPPPPSQENTLTQTVYRGGTVVPSTTQFPSTGLFPGDSASYTREEVRQAIRLGASLLPENPRQVKRFINLFRLYIYVANEQKLFQEENQVGLTMDRLATWVVWSLRWSELIRHLSEEASLLASESDLIAYIVKVAKSLEKDGSWVRSQPILNGHNDVPKDLVTFINDMRIVEVSALSHWCHLPWQLWFRNRDFLRCVKELEIIWLQPQSSKINWLHTMLLMTKITSATTVVPASNGNVQSSNLQNAIVTQPLP